LFTHARFGIWGESRHRPEDVAHDTGFAISAAPLLGVGLVFQGLASFDVAVDTTRAGTAAAGVIALLVGAVFAYVVYGVTNVVVYEREYHRLHQLDAETARSLAPYRRRARQGLRFWHRGGPEWPPNVQT
jgi:hypothetical protein